MCYKTKTKHKIDHGYDLNLTYRAWPRCILAEVFFLFYRKNIVLLSLGNRTEWSPIRSVIIRVITKSDDRPAGVRFVYHKYNYRPIWMTRSPITN